MTTLPLTTPRAKQRGAAAIMLALVLLLGLITLFTFRLDRRQPELDADKRTALALAEAKEILLGRAAWGNRPNSGTPDDPGTLNCPDMDHDGDPDTLPSGVCIALLSGQTYVGRLPVRTLRADKFRDSTGEVLWYMLSPNFADQGNAIVPTTSGTISVNGSAPIYAAIIFAPGAPLSGQNRLDIENVAQFLESYESTTSVNTVGMNRNDRILMISAADIHTVSTQRMAGELAKYLTTPPPYPSDTTWLPNTGEWAVGGHWHGWLATVVYDATDSSKPTLTFVGCAGAVYHISWDATLGKSVVQKTGRC